MKKKMVSTTLSVALILGSSAYASNGIDYTLSVNQESRVISVDMTLEGDNGGTAATGLVTNADGDIVFASQGYTDKNGKYDFSFINNDDNGNYTVTVAAPRKGLSESSSFKMLTGGMKTAISETTKDAAGMKQVIEDYGTYMNLDMTVFNALSDGDSVYGFMAEDAMIKMNDITSIADGFYGAVIIKTLAEGGNSTDYMNFLNSDMYSILNKDGIPMGENGSLFDELSSDVKDTVISKVLAKPYRSAAELSKSLEFYVLETSLEKALQWTEVNPVMKKYQEAGLLNVNFSTYNTLKNPQTADNAMIGKSFASYSEIESAFNTAVASALSAQNNSSVSGGGGSSGGGGGGGKAVPSVKVPEPVEKEKESVTSVFIDMEDYMWANEAVTYLAEKGIISGMGDGTFAPASGLTREEFSTIMVKTQKLSTEGKISKFNDIPDSRWSYPYVSAVYEAGILVGIGDDMFGATSNITRNEFAVIMKRLIDLYDVELVVNSNTKEYDDAESIPAWAKESIMFMKGTGLMLGSTGNHFSGSEVVSRAYACDILYAVLNAVNYDGEV